MLNFKKGVFYKLLNNKSKEPIDSQRKIEKIYSSLVIYSEIAIKYRGLQRSEKE